MYLKRSSLFFCFSSMQRRKKFHSARSYEKKRNLFSVHGLRLHSECCTKVMIRDFLRLMHYITHIHTHIHTHIDTEHFIPVIDLICLSSSDKRYVLTVECSCIRYVTSTSTRYTSSVGYFFF